MITSYEDFEVYKKSYGLAIKVHKITMEYPNHEKYEIGSQIRRAAMSIPLNIAEGYGKKTSVPEFKRFLNMAQGSANEMNVLIDISKDLGYIGDDIHKEMKEAYQTVGKQLNKLITNWK